MTLKAIKLGSGFFRESTTLAAEGQWWDGDKVRFRSGNPEKIGGWIRLSSETYLGVCRTLWNWIDFDGSNYLGLGTNLKYYIEMGGVYYDITPIRATFTTPVTNSCFSTTVNSSLVTATIPTHGATTEAFVTFSGAAAIGGIPAATLNAEYQVTVLDINTFTFDTGVLATSSVVSGGGNAITAVFQINPFSATYTYGNGWGAGSWGRGAWGSGTSFTVGTQLGLWTNDNFGQDLVIAKRNGAIYYWQDSLGVTARAQSLQALATAYDGALGPYVPNQTLQVMASAIQRFVIAFGANGYVPGTPTSAFDPMMVRWSDQSNPYQWVPSITNQAGEFRLSHGSTIIAAQITRQEILVWTDTALYSMQYLGTSYVWGFNVLMDNISLISPNAMITVNNATYWMGREKFFVYTGRVETLPSTLKQYVYDDINLEQSFQIFAGLNPGFNEIWWFYCSKHSTTIDKYVIYNYLENCWVCGRMARTAWLDSGIRQYPMAADYNGLMLYHEVGYDDGSGLEPVPIEAFVQSADFDIEDGHTVGFCWRIIPDVSFNGSTVNAPSVNMEVKPRQFPGSPYGTADNPEVISTQNYTPPNPPVYLVQEFTEEVFTRLRGRQMAFKVSSDTLGVSWTIGRVSIDTRLDGRR